MGMLIDPILSIKKLLAAHNMGLAYMIDGIGGGLAIGRASQIAAGGFAGMSPCRPSTF